MSFPISSHFEKASFSNGFQDIQLIIKVNKQSVTQKDSASPSMARD